MALQPVFTKTIVDKDRCSAVIEQRKNHALMLSGIQRQYIQWGYPSKFWTVCYCDMLNKFPLWLLRSISGAIHASIYAFHAPGVTAQLSTFAPRNQALFFAYSMVENAEHNWIGFEDVATKLTFWQRFCGVIVTMTMFTWVSVVVYDFSVSFI